jgi:chromosome segregation ATPase
MGDENGSSRLDRIERSIKNLRVNIESLHSSLSELHGIAREQGRAIENQRMNIESLHANMSELYGITQEQGRTVDRLIEHSRHVGFQIENLRVNIESLHSTAQEQGRGIDRLLAESQKDAESIRALARSAEIHERRLTDLEGGEEQ